jgi:hypothetical protein
MGIDAFGRARHLANQPAVAQFRNVRALTTRQIVDDLAAMDAGLPPPNPALFLVVSAAPRDARVQLELRGVSAERTSRGLSEIQVLFWDDVERLVSTNEAVLRKHYPDFAPRPLGPEEEARLRAQNAVIVQLTPAGSGFSVHQGAPVLGCMAVNQGETPFRVTEARAKWAFTEEFLAVEPALQADEREAQVQILDPLATPGKGAVMNVIMSITPSDDARVKTLITAWKGTSPVMATLDVRFENAAGTIKNARVELRWPKPT